MPRDTPTTDEENTTQRRLQHRERAIFHTLDALGLVAVLLGATFLAFQFVPATGGADVSADAQQLETNGEDLLTVTKSTGDLKAATVYWDDSNGDWVGANDFYTQFPTSHPLHGPFEGILNGSGINYDISITYLKASDGTETKRLYYQGTPGGDAVVAETTLILADNTTLAGPDSGTTVSESSTFYAPDAFPDSDRYNVLTVQITLWYG